MKAKQLIKMGFFLYVGWEISRVIDKILGVHAMDWLKEHKPDYAAKLEAEMARIL